MMKFIETFFPDYLSRVDRRGIFVVASLTTIAFVAFWMAKPPSRNSMKMPIARLANYSNNVRYKESGTITFYDVMKNEALQNEDEIFTGENSTAMVQFLNSKTTLKIPGASLVRIENGESGDVVEIMDGLIDILVKKDQVINIKTNGVQHQIKSDQKDSAVKAFYRSGELHFFTTDSGVKIRSHNEESELKPNRDEILVGNKLKNDSSFQLLLPIPGSKIDITDGIRISTSQKSRYEVTLSKKSDLSRPLARSNFNGTSLKWDTVVEEGNYYLRVEDEISNKTIPISLTSKYKIEGLTPADGELLDLLPGEKIMLRWKSKPVSTYKVVVQDSEGKEKNYVTNANELALNNLKGSQFKWTVVPEVTKGKYLNMTNTNQVRLKFNGKVEFDKIPEKTKFRVNEGKVSLSWKAIKDDQYIVKIFNTINNNEIFVEKLNQNQINLPMKTGGLYRVEVTSVGYPSLEKAIFNYEVNVPILTWDSKLQKEIKSIEEHVEIELSYKPNLDFGKNASVHMSYHPTVGNPIERTISLENTKNIKLKGFGRYCFRAQLNSPIEHYSASEDLCLKLIQLSLFEPLPRAKDSILTYVKHNGVDSYKIQLPVIRKAVKYHFEIYQDKLGKKLVHIGESKTPEIFWTGSRSGIYYLKYKVSDIKNRESNYSELSKLIFPISPLSDW